MSDANLLDQIWNAADKISVIALLLGNVYALVFGHLVPRYVLQLVIADKERYRIIAERAFGTTDRAVNAAESIAGGLP